MAGLETHTVRFITWDRDVGECSCGLIFRDDAKAHAHKCQTEDGDPLMAIYSKVKRVVTLGRRAFKPL